jgi:hypothetical protein
MLLRSEPTIFRFSCPVRGARPKEQTLSSYLNLWRSVQRFELDNLLNIFRKILTEVMSVDLWWKNTRFMNLLKEELLLVESIINLDENLENIDLLIVDENNRLCSNFDCPFCGIPAGPRPANKYFTVWSFVRQDQTANLLYEMGLVLSAIIRTSSCNIDTEYSEVIEHILKANRQSQEAIGLMECLRCERVTSGLYGTGTIDNPYRCRWCLDREQIGLTIKGIVDFRLGTNPNFE